MSAATDVYKDQVYCLWHARRLAEDFGPEGRKLSQDEEAVRAECLSLLREQMTPAERTEMEAWLIAHHPESEPLDSDGWPRAPDPPKELRVVPVFMRNGEWAWFQGAPDGFRYILADESSSGVSTDADADRRASVIVKTPGVADGRARGVVVTGAAEAISGPIGRVQHYVDAWRRSQGSRTTEREARESVVRRVGEVARLVGVGVDDVVRWCEGVR